MFPRKLIFLLFFCCCASYQNLAIFEKLKQCTSNNIILCLKEKALDVLDETINSDRPLSIYGVDIARDANYVSNKTNSDERRVRQNSTERSFKINDILYDKIQEFIKSRVVKLHMADIFEGRKKGGGGKKGNMMLMAGIGVAGMLTQLFLAKIAFMAGAALLIAKIALMFSFIMGLKKISSGDGGVHPEHVVYADTSGYGHEGWHRSYEDETQNIPYKSYMPTQEEHSKH